MGGLLDLETCASYMRVQLICKYIQYTYRAKLKQKLELMEIIFLSNNKSYAPDMRSFT